MYGAPTLGYGSEVVKSLNALADCIKRRQILRPRSELSIYISGSGNIKVNLLPNGLIELGGSVQPIQVEKEIEIAMQMHGAIVQEVLV